MVVTAAVGLSFAKGETLARAQASALGVLAIRIAGAGLAYGAQVLLARLMGKAEYGVFAAVWVWIIILGHGSLWGFGQSVCRFVPTYRARGELDLARGFLAGGAAFTLVSGLSIAALGGFALWCAQDWLTPAYLWPLAIALAVVPLFAVQDYVEGVARSFGWTGLAIAPLYILRQGLIVAAMAGAVLLFAVPAEPWVAVACTLAATGIALAMQGTVLVRRLRRAAPGGRRAYRWRAWVSASLPIAFVDLTASGFNFVDVVLLGFFLPPEAVAVYFAATRILQFVVFVQYAATAATAQRFAEAWAHEDHATLRALVVRTARLASLSTLVVGAAVLAAAPLLLALFGPGFSASVGVLAILIGGVVLQSAFGPAEDLLNMLGGERLCALVSVGFLALAVGLNLALIPAFGVMGAAVAMALSNMGRGLALSMAARMRLGLATHVLAHVEP